MKQWIVKEVKYHNTESYLAGFQEHYASRTGVTLHVRIR